jgi:hypothetical protein
MKKSLIKHGDIFIGVPATNETDASCLCYKKAEIEYAETSASNGRRSNLQRLIRNANASKLDSMKRIP